MKSAALWLAALILVTAAFAAEALAANAERGWHGNYFPNVVLTTQDGKKVRFYDDLIRGKTVSINFIYTSCGDICPLDTAQLRQVHALLGDRVGKDIFMYSISIDPERDTPAALKRYMHSFDVGKGWTFLTGKKADIELLQKRLGIRPVELGKLREHDTRLMMGNEKNGSWLKRSPYDDPKILADLLGEALTNYATSHSEGGVSYDRAVEIGAVSRGSYLYRTRCDSCHTIGGGDRLGPDLAGVVASRPKEWLIRWLKEPDKMLAEGDPTATALKKRFRNLPMPNLGLNDIDANALIDFMAEQDKLRAAPKAASAEGKASPKQP